MRLFWRKKGVKYMVVLMRSKTDCEVAALATALGITWEESQKLLDWRRLPKGLENPVFGNPLNLYRALADAGYWKINKTLTQLLKGDYTPGKCIMLVHNPSNPTMQQHWILLGAKRPDHGGFDVFWGDSEQPRFITESMLKEYFLGGWPNCSFEPYKAHIIRIWWEKIKAFFGVKSE
jgi:hypothetical protein